MNQLYDKSGSPIIVNINRQQNDFPMSRLVEEIIERIDDKYCHCGRPAIRFIEDEPFCNMCALLFYQSF